VDMMTTDRVRPGSGSAWRQALGNGLVRWGLALIAALVLVAVAADFLAPHDPRQQFADGLDDSGMPVPPSARFPLGTDSLGRDVLSRLLHGTRISLLVGTVAMLTAALIGVGVGLAAGYGGPWADMPLMRLTDVMMSLPGVLLAMALVGLMQDRDLSLPLVPGRLVSVLLVIGIISWTGIARVVRGQVLTLKERPFVEAARALGFSHTRILLRHILPNLLPAILVLAALGTASTMGMEAGLSFLGIGLPPSTPSWGVMINEGQPYLLVAPWLVLPPGSAIILAVLGFNLLGQGLQDALDPYQRAGAAR
jgi:peptide/nickel transport system permease protein